MQWNKKRVLPSLLTALTLSIVPLLRHRNTWEFLKQLALLNEAHYVVIGFRGAEREEKSKMENEEIGRGA